MLISECLCDKCGLLMRPQEGCIPKFPRIVKRVCLDLIGRFEFSQVIYLFFVQYQQVVCTCDSMLRVR